MLNSFLGLTSILVLKSTNSFCVMFWVFLHCARSIESCSSNQVTLKFNTTGTKWHVDACVDDSQSELEDLDDSRATGMSTPTHGSLSIDGSSSKKQTRLSRRVSRQAQLKRYCLKNMKNIEETCDASTRE